MSTWKAASKDAPRTPRLRPESSPRKRPPAPLVDVVSLEIDRDEDNGGDPYNHTGQFCTVEIDRYRE